MRDETRVNESTGVVGVPVEFDDMLDH